MKQFFSSVKFKVLVCLLALMAGFMAYAAANGRWSAAPQELLASVLVPFQELGRLISGGIRAIQQRTVEVEAVLAENQRLREELDELRRRTVDYDDMAAENRLYREYYQIADTYTDYELVSAFVIGRDPLDKYYAFTIDRGRRDGVDVNDVVISPQGVVGRITAVGYNYAEVLTVLDPQVSMGCTISRTRDIGLAEGDALLAGEGLLKMSYLPRETLAAEGDLVVTTGLGGVFPAGLIVGTVDDVLPESSGKSMYAVVDPAADVLDITSVFVITDYEDTAPAPPGAAAQDESGAPVEDGAQGEAAGADESAVPDENSAPAEDGAQSGDGVDDAAAPDENGTQDDAAAPTEGGGGA